jgi:hypothetical protein
MKRPGYYVEGEWFKDRFHQARARAAYLAEQYGRPVDLKRLEHESDSFQLVLTVINGKKKVA